MNPSIKTHPHWAGDRCFVIESKWDDERHVGRWTFECKQGHVWEEDAIWTGKVVSQLKGKPMSPMQFRFHVRYWGKDGDDGKGQRSGVSTYCPICNPEYYRARRRGVNKKVLKD